jgi:hypothetical protein
MSDDTPRQQANVPQEEPEQEEDTMLDPKMNVNDTEGYQEGIEGFEDAERAAALEWNVKLGENEARIVEALERLLHSSKLMEAPPAFVEKVLKAIADADIKPPKGGWFRFPWSQ